MTSLLIGRKGRLFQCGVTWGKNITPTLKPYVLRVSGQSRVMWGNKFEGDYIIF